MIRQFPGRGLVIEAQLKLIGIRPRVDSQVFAVLPVYAYRDGPRDGWDARIRADRDWGGAHSTGAWGLSYAVAGRLCHQRMAAVLWRIWRISLR